MNTELTNPHMNTGIVIQNAPGMPATKDNSNLYRQASAFIKSGLAPVHIKTPEQALIIAAQGRELGIPFYSSMGSFYVIGNQAHPSVQLKLGLAMQSGQLEDFTVTPGLNEAIAMVKRKGRKSPIVTKFGIKEATALQLINKDNYKKQPMTMYQWRALSSALDLAFADVLSGLGLSPTPNDQVAAIYEPSPEPIEAHDIPPQPEQLEAPQEEVQIIEETPFELGQDPSTEELIFDIRDKLGAMNGGEIDAMNAHLKKITLSKDKTKYLTMESLVKIAPKFPDWIKKIHGKVVAEFKDEFKAN